MVETLQSAHSRPVVMLSIAIVRVHCDVAAARHELSRNPGTCLNCDIDDVFIHESKCQPNQNQSVTVRSNNEGSKHIAMPEGGCRGGCLSLRELLGR